MARLLGPDANTRLVYLLGAGNTLYGVPGSTATIYSDPAATVLADICTYNGTGTVGAAISGSQVTVDATSRLPLFWFPDSTAVVYAKVNNGVIVTLNADYGARIDALAATAGSGSYVSTSALGAANGVAQLDGSGHVPTAQLPAQGGTYVSTSAVGTANGVASLDATTKIPAAQIPDLSGTYLTGAAKAAANGVASLNASSQVVQPPASAGQASGLATLDATGKIPTGQLPTAAAGGVSTDANNFLGVGSDGKPFMRSQTGWINVRDRGAKGDGTTDDTAAVQAAISGLPTQGGTVYFPPGKYLVSATLTNTGGTVGSADIILRGAGGRNSGNFGFAGASRIIFTGTGTGAVIDLRSTSGVQIHDLCIEHTSTSFTGRMVDLRNTATSDTAYPLVANCYIAGPTGSATAIGIDLDKATRVTIRECAIYAMATCISGKGSASTYSNQVKISDVGFNKSNVAIHNPGQAWLVQSCTFEGSGSAVAGAMDHDSGVTCEGLTVMSCWSGDVTSGTQFVVAGTGISIIGNWIGCTNGTGITTDGIVTGLTIFGNIFQSCSTGINLFTSSSNSGQVITGNTYNSVTTRFTGTLSAGAIYNDDPTSANDPTIYGLKHAGSRLGFYGAAAIAKPTVTGAKGSNAALTSLLSTLATLGIIADSTT